MGQSASNWNIGKGPIGVAFWPGTRVAFQAAWQYNRGNDLLFLTVMPLKVMIMNILLNGELKQLDNTITIAGLLQEMGLTERRVAVEVNREIVPRSRHAGHQLQDQDRIEVVNAIGGG
jgi:sulfur carrier protein